MKKMLAFGLCLFSAFSFSQDITGDWFGNLNVMGTQLGITFTINQNESRYYGSMSVPQQQAYNIPLTKVNFQNNQLNLGFEPAGISYTGNWNEDQTFTGTFTQNGQRFPMTLAREKTTETKPLRPQEPKEPFPYNIEEVVFPNPNGNFNLAGTLTFPKTKSFPVVILISGSGPQNRDSEIFGHKPFWVIADHLTRNGIAVFRIDDRGVGQSGGDPSNATSFDFAQDIEAALTFLKNKPGFKFSKLGLIGHSEGGMIAPIVAANEKSVNFVILLAGPGIPCDELLLEQTLLITKNSDLKDLEIQKTFETNKALYAIAKSNSTENEAQLEMEKWLKEAIQSNSAYATFSENEKKQLIEEQTNSMLSPWFRYFVRFNPEDYLKKLKCPVLALNGSKDLQVAPKSNLNGIQKSLELAGNKKVTVKEYADLNHLFQKCETGRVEEYGTIEETFSREVLDDITQWIKSLSF